KLYARENLVRQARELEPEQVANRAGARQAVPALQVLRDRARGELAGGVQLDQRMRGIGNRSLRAKKRSLVVPRFEEQREERPRLLEQRFGVPALPENDREQFDVACLSNFGSVQHFRLLGQ